MAYKSLEKLFHSDVSSERFANNARLAEQRLNSVGAYRSGFVTSAGELFLAIPHELSTLNESVLRVERRISLQLQSLSPVARGALVRDLVINEVVSTNEIENIHSTRRQISDALDSLPVADDDPLAQRRFRELAKLYLGLSQKEAQLPSNPEDIRGIYDRVMAKEPIPEQDRPDGRLIRKGKVEVIGMGVRVLHEGLYPERAIYDALVRMIALGSSEDMPQIYSAILVHYLFEYIHPFYDGNGRTGRYLLALYLSRPLSTLTALSLSRSIAENKGRYYKAFREAEDPLNHGELTFFVIGMLEMIQSAQYELLDRLDSSKGKLEDATRKLDELVKDLGLTKQEGELLYLLVQLSLYSTFPTASLARSAEYLGLGKQQTRKYVSQLEGRGLLTISRRRPLSLELSPQARQSLGMEKPGA